MALNKARKQLEQRAGVITETAKGLGSKAASGAIDGARAVSDIAQDGRQKLRMSIYNPLFPEEYASADFDLPKMIVIVDEDMRKGIDVCEGAIGWLSKAANLEVLHLYEEAVDMSGLCFHPIPACDSVYYIDYFNKERFINLMCYFDVVLKDKTTELIDIANSLGAKKCQIHTYELDKTISIKNRHLDKKTLIMTPEGKAKIESSVDVGSINEQSSERKILFSQTLEGDAAPRRPELHWYAHDNEIKRLINARCAEDGRNRTITYHLELDSSITSTISIALASKIDSALGKLGASCNFSLKGEAQKESRQRLLFDIEF